MADSLMELLRGGISSVPDASAGPLFFPHGLGDVPAAPEGMAQNIVQQFGAAPSGDSSQPFWSNVTPEGDTTGTQTIYNWNNASDPRVDAWYAAHAAGPVEGADRSGPSAAPLAGPDSVQLMAQMMRDIPDAGKGSSLGSAGTLHDRIIRQIRDRGGDPATEITGQVGFYGGGWDNLSTDNWHLLPPPYQRPGYIMRNGIVIDTNDGGYKAGYPAGYGGGMNINDAGQNAPLTGVYAPHMGPHDGYPASYGLNGLNYGWPGALWGWQGDRPVNQVMG